MLVDFPNGKHVLVDAGPSQSVVSNLTSNLSGNHLDWLWITHPHVDHFGGATAVLDKFQVDTFIDNGESAQTAMISKLHDVVTKKKVKYEVVSPTKRSLPSLDTGLVKVSLIAPTAWPVSNCAGENADDCSIGLRLDFCKSSVLLVGDTEKLEEAQIDSALGPATLLQVGHHGSDTSTSDAFLAMVKPKYSVFSAGKPHEGKNKTYCHPRQVTVDRLNTTLGGSVTGTIEAFDGSVKCEESATADKHWHQVATNDHMWFTERDGDVVLSTKGDGTFQKVE